VFACPAPSPEPLTEILVAAESTDPTLILREAVHSARALGVGGAARILAPPPAPGLLVRADRALLGEACLKLLSHAARRVGYGGLVLPAMEPSAPGLAIWIVWDEPTADPGPMDALIEVRATVRAMAGDLTFSVAGASRALTLRLPAAGTAPASRSRLAGARIRLIGGDPAEVAYARRALIAQGAATETGVADAVLLFAEVEPARLIAQTRTFVSETSPPPLVVVADAKRSVDPIQLRALRPAAWLDRPATGDHLVSALHRAIWPGA